jgi:hypothetical protein|tara:strand:- start:5747 stop:7969 length:2223 start_codon:yes stop_codon:yes gene_type:complete
MYGAAKIPQQRLPLSKKTKKWREECVDAFINISKFGLSERRSNLKALYDYYNGEVDETDYRYVIKPYGKSRENFPSKLRNYPIIKPIIDLLLGEKSKRPLNYTVTVKNADSISLKEEAKTKQLRAAVEAMFLNEIAKPKDLETQQIQEQQPPLPKQVAEQFERTYVDDRAIKGQSAMNYIMYEQEMYDKFQKQFFHFLVSGETYSHKGVRRSEPFYDVINPIDIDFDKDPDVEFVEDGDWAIVRRYSHAATVIDHFGDYLTEEQVLQLEDPKHQSVDTYLLYRSEATGADDNIYRNRLVEVVTVYWKSRKRIGFVSYTDPQTGVIEEFEVAEGYRMPAEIKEMGGKIKYEWVNEVWEGTKIDGRFYVKTSPIPNQRTSLDNPSRCKLPINGFKYSDINSSNISLVSLGIPFQINYNIFKYRMELAIARSKDIIAQFDINMIPKKWDLDKFMYYVEGTGIAWVDYNKEGIQLSPQHQSVLDMSIKTIEQYVLLLETTMQEWEKISGVNRQRQGTIGAYEGKGSSQQAIVQSSHITEDLFRKFARFEQRELQGMLDYSKEAWISGKKGMYVLPDTTTQFIDMDSLAHMESEYGIFVSDAGRDQENIRQAKELSQAMIQNGMPASAVLDLMDTENFSGIKEKLRKAEAAQAELEAAQQQAQQQQAQQAMQMEQMKMQQEAQEKDRDRRKDIEVALINAEAKDQANRLDIDLQKIMMDHDIKEKEIDLKREALDKEGDTEPNGE